MKSLLQLWQTLAQDLGEECRVSTAHDYQTVVSRTEHEGLSFLTITLPAFGKDFDEALSIGKVSHTHFSGFRRRGGTPLFLGGFLENVFNTSSGQLLDDPCIRSITAVRQLSALCGKIEVECTKRRVDAAYEKYIQAEEQLKEAESGFSDSLLDQFSRISRLLFARVFSRIDGKVSSFDLRPKHGSGATANALHGNAKYVCLQWTERLERVFPSSEYLLPNVRFHQRLDRDELLEPGSEIPVKVTHVPKTLKTPRIIAEEPSYMMFMQQALWLELKHLLEADPLTSGLLGFTLQAPNQELARRGSIDGSLATLDLSEASDRVSNMLVKAMCKNHPHFDEAVQACRSTHARVPGYGVIPLTKFASMGSALCFPFEAMVFLTIIILAMELQEGKPFTRQEVKNLAGKVRVYGDDIIVPTKYAENVSALLGRFGLVVNQRKSFWNGSFRESCGSDWFRGQNVRPVRVKSHLPITRQDATEAVSTVSLRNQLFELGRERAVEYLDSHLERVLRTYPSVRRESSLLGRWSVSDLTVDYIHGSTQQPMVEGYALVSTPRVSPLDDIGALLKFFLVSNGDLPVTDKDHLYHSGRPVAVSLQRRKQPVY